MAIALFYYLSNAQRSLITIILIKAIESLRSFDLIYTMTKGGPGITTETLDLYAYQQGIGLRGEIYSSAMSVAMVIYNFSYFYICLEKSSKRTMKKKYIINFNNIFTSSICCNSNTFCFARFI